MKICRWCILLSVLFLFFSDTVAQESFKGNKIIHFSIGPNLANFLSAEAPHKLYTFGPDTAFAEHDPVWDIDYQTSLFGDILLGVATGFSFEYFFGNSVSISGGINYEMKGINLNYTALEKKMEKTFECKIKNNYVTIPILIRSYLGEKKEFFMMAGFYSGFLVSSKIHYYKEIFYPEDQSSMKLWSDGKDEDLDYTSNFDFGVTLGGGFLKDLSEKFTLRTELLLNFGMIKLDAKYDNDYEELVVPGGSQLMKKMVRSKNYFGLNSNSRNISLALNVGIGYRIGNN